MILFSGTMCKYGFFFGKEAKTSACGPGKENDHDMAIYHLEAKVITRGIGRTACGAAAYMSCSKFQRL